MRKKLRLESPKGIGHLEDLGVHKRIILKRIKKIGSEVLNWIHLNQDRYQWKTLLDTAVTFRVS
jgi:hypothetical protein